MPHFWRKKPQYVFEKYFLEPFMDIFLLSTELTKITYYE